MALQDICPGWQVVCAMQGYTRVEGSHAVLQHVVADVQLSTRLHLSRLPCSPAATTRRYIQRQTVDEHALIGVRYNCIASAAEPKAREAVAGAPTTIFPFHLTSPSNTCSYGVLQKCIHAKRCFVRLLSVVDTKVT